VNCTQQRPHNLNFLRLCEHAGPLSAIVVLWENAETRASALVAPKTCKRTLGDIGDRCRIPRGTFQRLVLSNLYRRYSPSPCLVRSWSKVRTSGHEVRHFGGNELGKVLPQLLGHGLAQSTLQMSRAHVLRSLINARCGAGKVHGPPLSLKGRHMFAMSTANAYLPHSDASTAASRWRAGFFFSRLEYFNLMTEKSLMTRQETRAIGMFQRPGQKQVWLGSSHESIGRTAVALGPCVGLYKDTRREARLLLQWLRYCCQRQG
jgi:hypothetical protein